MSNSSVNQSKKYLLLEGTEKLVYEPLQKLILPYVLFPVSLIQDKYFRGREGKKILCKIQHFRKEKKTPVNIQDFLHVYITQFWCWAVSTDNDLWISPSTTNGIIQKPQNKN